MDRDSSGGLPDQPVHRAVYEAVNGVVWDAMWEPVFGLVGVSIAVRRAVDTVVGGPVERAMSEVIS